MSVKIDLKDLKDLQKSVEDRIKNQDELLRRCVNDIALRVFRAANKNTPVDTGLLRESWDLGPIIKKGNHYEVKIMNSVDYAQYVEYGHRLVTKGVTVGWVEGQFMLTIAEDEVVKRMDRIIQLETEKYLEEMFK